MTKCPTFWLRPDGPEAEVFTLIAYGFGAVRGGGGHFGNHLKNDIIPELFFILTKVSQLENLAAFNATLREKNFC